jgi:serine/threonine-protein kinase
LTAPLYAPAPAPFSEPPTIPATAPITAPAIAPPPPDVVPSRRGWWVTAVAALLVLGLVALVTAAVRHPGWLPGAGWVTPVPVTGTKSLPEGYTAEDPNDLVDGRPRVLVRSPDGLRLIRIAGGEFSMGDAGNQGPGEDRPAHPVVLSGYYLQETEVTNDQMEAYFVARNVPVKDRPPRWREAVDALVKAGYKDQAGRHPAVGIPHEVAVEFARWAGGALPTEAQWEYAARSRGKAVPYVWGTERGSKSSANLNNTGEVPPTSEVGHYPKDRTEQGVFDLAGNVREWCRDRWGLYEASAVARRDPEGPREGTGYVVRGGSFNTWLDLIRTTRPRRPNFNEDGAPTADQIKEDGSADDLGFRVVIEWPPKP